MKKPKGSSGHGDSRDREGMTEASNARCGRGSTFNGYVRDEHRQISKIQILKELSTVQKGMNIFLGLTRAIKDLKV